MYFLRRVYSKKCFEDDQYNLKKSKKEPGKISQASKGILRQHINGHRRKQNQCPYFGNYINLGKIE